MHRIHFHGAVEVPGTLSFRQEFHRGGRNNGTCSAPMDRTFPHPGRLETPCNNTDCSCAGLENFEADTGHAKVADKGKSEAATEQGVQSHIDTCGSSFFYY